MLKLRSPSPSSSGVSRGLAAISPQTDTGIRIRSAASVANCTSRSTAGCSGSYSSATSVSAAIDRQRVGGQVIGADGEEIGLQRQRIGRQRGAGRLDHDAERRQLLRHPLAAAAQPPRHALVDLARRAHLADRGHHRQHHPHRAGHGGAQDGGELGLQQFRSRRSSRRMPRRPSAGLASATSGTMPASGQRLDVLLAAPVQHPDGHRIAAHRLDDRAIGFGLGVLVRNGLAVHEQELGAQQADADGARLRDQRQLDRQFQVGLQFDRLAVQRFPPAGGAAGHSAAAPARRR